MAKAKKEPYPANTPAEPSTYPVDEVKILVCRRCGERVQRPHTPETCPMGPPKVFGASPKQEWDRPFVRW